MPRFWDRIRDTATAVIRAIRDPRSYAPPPLPTQPPEPPRRARNVTLPPRRERERQRRPEPRVSRPVARSELPESWGPNKAGLWADATTTEHRLARDERAQDFYDAALYTFSEDSEQRATNLANFKDYIWDEYGIDWDEIFDWEAYRENYDTTSAH